jgi:hypothetical protein
MSKDKKAVKAKRQPVEPTVARVQEAIAECSVPDVSLPGIRKLLDCTWKEAITIRHAALKQLKAK